MKRETISKSLNNSVVYFEKVTRENLYYTKILYIKCVVLLEKVARPLKTFVGSTKRDENAQG